MLGLALTDCDSAFFLEEILFRCWPEGIADASPYSFSAVAIATGLAAEAFTLLRRLTRWFALEADNEREPECGLDDEAWREKLPETGREGT